MLKSSHFSALTSLKRARSAVPNGPISALACLLIVTILLACFLPNRFVVLNRSPSVAPGLYIAIDAAPDRARLVEFRLPEGNRDTEATDTAFRGSTATIIKPIRGVSGDHIDTTGSRLRINGIDIAPIQTRDSNGRLLSVWRANRRLEHGEYFVFSPNVRSYDSRYFGVIRREDIISVRAPWITWDHH